MRVFLETERLVLRRFTMADLDGLVGLDADPEVMHFVTGGLPTSRDTIEGEVLPTFLGYYEEFVGYGFWAAVERSSGEFLGWFHLRPREDSAPGEVELGYRLRRSAWGKGYATEGSRAVIRKRRWRRPATTCRACSATTSWGRARPGMAPSRTRTRCACSWRACRPPRLPGRSRSCGRSAVRTTGYRASLAGSSRKWRRSS